MDSYGHHHPRVVVFNGSEGALTRERLLKAKTGETVRIVFGNAGPNLTSAFHVIGSNFRRAWRDGDVVSPPGRFVSTVLVPPGSAAVMDLKMVVPGTYALVNMFGDRYLCCPVMQPGATRLKVYLPAGAKWTALEGEGEFEGGQTVEVDCPIEYMPVFVRR